MAVINGVLKMMLYHGKGPIGWDDDVRSGAVTYAQKLLTQPFAGMYQWRPRPSGRIFVQCALYVPVITNTPAQQARRAVFRHGHSAWRALSPTAQDVWRKKAYRKKMTGFNLFMSDYLYTH